MNKDIIMNSDEEITVTLTLDGDETLECQVLTILEDIEGRDYIALLPLEGEAAESGDVYLYRYKDSASGEPDLENIDDDEEYDIVADAFEEYLDTIEFDELVEDDAED